MTTATKATPQKRPVRVEPSDDFVLNVNGEDYGPHAGQSVTFTTAVPIGLLRFAHRTIEVDRQMDALKDASGNIAPERAAEAAAVMDKHYGDLCRMLAYVVLGWDWMDTEGRPLPQPNGTEEVFDLLTTEEVYYLFAKAQAPSAPAASPAPPATEAGGNRRAARK